MKINPRNLTRILTDAHPEGLTTKELLSRAGQKKSKKASLRKVMHELMRKERCYRSKGRYFLKDSKQIKAKPLENRGSEEFRFARKKGRIERPQGLFLVDKGRGFVQHFNGKTRYPVDRKDLMGLLHGDEVRFRLKKSAKHAKTAQITQVVRHKASVLSGRLEKVEDRVVFRSFSKAFLEPFSVGNPEGLDLEEPEVFFQITHYPENGEAPKGLVLKRPEELKETERVQMILAQYKIATRFHPKTENEADGFSKKIAYDPDENRKDLRHLPFVTIDGADARDFDDAIYAEKTVEGGYRLWVSIADVAEYVRPNSRLDLEAEQRGTSVYLPDFAIPMLPEVLSNGLCSLNKGVNRKTMTCEMTLDDLGNPINTEVYASLSKIKHRLTYPEVQEFIDSDELPKKFKDPDLKSRLGLYLELARVLEKRRRQRGSINFNMPESAFQRDKTGRVTDLLKTYQSQAMKVIEQMMLEANENVGKFCEEHKIPIVWRNHPPPLPQDLVGAKKALWNINLKLKKLSDGKDYNQVLDQTGEHPLKDLIEKILLRSMSLAKYGNQRQGHFGLAATHYCHFTSPIRRYPDLLTHRSIKAYLAGNKPPSIRAEQTEVLSDRERAAEKAEKNTVKLKKLLFMSRKLGQVFEVTVTGMIHSGLFVGIERPFADCFVPFRSIYDDHYVYDENLYAAKGKSTKRLLRVGSRLTAILTKIDLQNLSPEMEWIGWDKEVGS